jgi:hypothetical protein
LKAIMVFSEFMFTDFCKLHSKYKMNQIKCVKI